jgi:hypothetical protein
MFPTHQRFYTNIELYLNLFEAEYGLLENQNLSEEFCRSEYTWN